MRGFAAIGLDNPKCNENVGSALRACGVYNAALLMTTGMRYKKNKLDTRSQHRHMPFIQVDDLIINIPYGCVPVAVDLIDGAESIVNYIHPERALYIFGAEDATLGARIINKCRDVIFVPTNGCMNLAATVNVVLYDRLQKQLVKEARNK